MSAAIPDHAALPVERIRWLLQRSKNDMRYPEDALDRAFCRAMEAASDTAREMLEAMPLEKTMVMHIDFWNYALRILGEYSTTIPSGTHVGKRWCRIERPASTTTRRFIGEYVESANPKRGGIVWYEVTLKES